MNTFTFIISYATLHSDVKEQKIGSTAQCILLILIDYLLFPGSGNILNFLFSINIWIYDSFCFFFY